MYWFAFYNMTSEYAESPKEFLDGLMIFKGNKDDILDFAWQGALTDTNCTSYYKTKRELMIEIIYHMNQVWSGSELIGFHYARRINNSDVTDLRGDW